MTLGRQGAHANLGLPGTGLSIREKLPTTTPGQGTEETHAVRLRLDLGDDGRLEIATPDGLPLPPAVEKIVRRDESGQLRAWLQEECAKRNEGAESLLALNREWPGADSANIFVPTPYTTPPPVDPVPPRFGFWDTVFSARRSKKERAFDAARRAHARAMVAWQAAKACHEDDQARLRWRSEVGRVEDEMVMEELLGEALKAIPWPRDTKVEFEVSLKGRLLDIDVDLPEVEDMPVTSATVALRGLKLNLQKRSEAQIRKLYAEHIHGVILRVIATAFLTLPQLQRAICSGYSQRPNPVTGETRDDYLLSVIVEREQWQLIHGQAIANVNPEAFLSSCQLRREMTVRGVFCPIEPFDAARPGSSSLRDLGPST